MAAGRPEVRPVGLKLHGRIEAKRHRVTALGSETLYSAKIELSESKSGCFLPPRFQSACGVRKQSRPIDEEERLALHADVAIIRESVGEEPKVAAVVVVRMALRYQFLATAAVPRASPRLVGPAEAERKPGLAGRQDVGKRPLEQSPTFEPVVVIAKPCTP